VITALVTASGPLGLSAVFPPATATFTNPETDNPPHVISAPHLPLEDTWEGIDFSIENVMHTTAQPGEEVDLRHWCMLLLSRYLYVSGSSLVHFHMLRNPDQARKTFDDSLDKNRQVSILGLNDDIDKGYDEVRGLMNKWFNSRWPEPNVWERQ
jgi:3-O-alpha-D-mannopyranosyl-alpha-D-mannopyranose xylosylphosphotransferase